MMQELVLPLLLHRALCAKFKSKKPNTAYWLNKLLNIISAEQTFASSPYGNMLITTNKAFPQQQLPHFSKVNNFLRNWHHMINLLFIPYALVREHWANKLNFCILSQLSLANQATLFNFLQLIGTWATKKTF